MKYFDEIVEIIFDRHRAILVGTFFAVLIILVLTSAAGAQALPTSPPVDIPTSQLWLIVVPILLTIFLSLMRYLPPTTPDIFKKAITAAFSAILAAIGLSVEDRLNFDDWLRTALFILFVAAGSYALVWKQVQDSVIFGIKETAIIDRGSEKGRVVDVGK